jgi:integrase
MAAFEQRESGWWQAKIRRKGLPTQSRTFERKMDAEAWARDIENKMDRGIFVDRSAAENTTLHGALERYELEVSIFKDGHDVEKWRIKQWKDDKLSQCSLASLRASDFAKWRDKRLEFVSASTVKKDLAVISHLFTVAAKEWGIAVENPIRSISLPSEDNSRNRRLEGDEEIRLLNALAESGAGERANIWMKPLVQLAIQTAARQSELLALEWSNVDLSKSVIRFFGKERTDGKRRTKNGDKLRDVPLSSRAKEILSELPRAISGKVFPTTASAVKQSFSRACKRAEIEDFTFHDLRHEATSILAEKLQMHELMKVTGHKDSRMLARYYHPRAEDLAKKLG